MKKQNKMSKNKKTNATCQRCGVSLPPTHTGPCPKCGKEGKIVTVELKETLRVKDFLSWERRREFFEKNLKIKWLIIVISFASPLLGLFLSGIVGLIIGFAFSILLYLLGPIAVTKVREIERSNP